MLCHLPRNWIVASGMPCWVAVVAAPAWKLWPEYEPWQIPKLSWSLFTKQSLVGGFPSLKWNRGPPVSPQTGKYAIIAIIRHRQLWVWPRYMSTPFLNESVLEYFIQTCMMVGLLGYQMQYLRKSEVPLSHGHCRMEISPACRKPKKHVYTDHAMMLLKFSGC